MLWEVSSTKRCRGCGRWPVDKGEPVTVYRQTYGEGEEARTAAHVAGVQTCGSPWVCPVCAAKIRQRRAVEIEQALTRHLEAGGGALFLTLTMPHDVGDRLEPMLQAVAYGWNAALSGRKRKKLREKYELCGYIKATEPTHGPNGWHPHIHAILLFNRRLRGHERGELHELLHGAWSRAVQRKGYRRPEPYLCKLGPVQQAYKLAQYVGKAPLTRDENGELRKLGLELARHDLKAGRESGSRGAGELRHRSPWEILQDFAITGDCADLDRWHEYEQATKGKRSITWSQGLKDRLLVQERTDEELAEEEVGGEEIGTIPLQLWHRITSRPGGVAGLLEAAETGGAAAVGSYVWQFRSGKSPPKA